MTSGDLYLIASLMIHLRHHTVSVASSHQGPASLILSPMNAQHARAEDGATNGLGIFTISLSCLHDLESLGAFVEK